MSETLAVLNHRPIEFYGKLIDQSGIPVGGAKVFADVMVAKAWMAGKGEFHYTATDENGLFTYKGIEGRDIAFGFEKPGYEYRTDRSKMALFKYSLLTPAGERHHPDPGAPVIFTIWKLTGPESLIRGDKFLGIKADGTPFTVDLVKGRKCEGRLGDGDLVVAISQPPQIAVGQRFDWSFSIEAIGGGLIEAVDPQYLNEAPVEGYKPQMSQEVKATDRDWSEVVRKTFYVKSRNGNQFARVIAEIHANYQGAAVFSVRYLLNPRPGSRNLEYDPSKEVSAAALK